MSYLKEIRQRIGISQAEMARLLGTKESQVAMAELGKRSLPNKSSDLLYLLERAVDKAANSPWPVMVPAVDEKSEKIREKKKRTDTVQLDWLHITTERLEEKIKKCVQLYRFADLVITERLLPEQGQVYLYMEILKLSASLSYDNHHAAWKTAQVKIAGLQAALRKMEELE